MLRIGHIPTFKNRTMSLQTIEETQPLLLVMWQPGNLRECKQTWQKLVFQFSVVIGGFCPHVALYPKSIFHLTSFAQAFQWVKLVNLLHTVHIIISPSAAITFINIGLVRSDLHPVEIKHVVGYDDTMEAL